MRYTIAGIRSIGGIWEQYVVGSANTPAEILDQIVAALNAGCVYVYVLDTTTGNFTEATQ